MDEGQSTAIRLISDIPLYAADAAHRRVGQLVEGVRREVEIVHGTSLAPVGQRDINGLAIVYSPRERLAGLEGERDQFYVQVTLAVLPHNGFVFGSTPL